MEIQKADLKDVEMLRDFAERTFRLAYEADNEPETFQAYCRDAFTVEQFRREMEHPQSGFWLGWQDGVFVAYLKLNFNSSHEDLEDKKAVQVERIYVDPDFQGRRLGEELLDFAYDQAIQAGATWIWLSVWELNPRAVRFYERCGYEIFGTDIFHLADDPQLDWAMKKRVNF